MNALEQSLKTGEPILFDSLIFNRTSKVIPPLRHPDTLVDRKQQSAKTMAASVVGYSSLAIGVSGRLVIKSKSAALIAPLSNYPAEAEVTWFGGNVAFNVLGKGSVKNAFRNNQKVFLKIYKLECGSLSLSLIK